MEEIPDLNSKLNKNRHTSSNGKNMIRLGQILEDYPRAIRTNNDLSTVQPNNTLSHEYYRTAIKIGIISGIAIGGAVLGVFLIISS